MSNDAANRTAATLPTGTQFANSLLVTLRNFIERTERMGSLAEPTAIALRNVEQWLIDDLPLICAAERRSTIERIRERMDLLWLNEFDEIELARALAILDEEDAA